MIDFAKIRIVATGGWIFYSLAAVLLAQPTLRITSPKDGTVVSPGQSLVVTVAASPERAFQQVIIGGQNPIGFSQVVTTPPYQFTIQIPQTIDPGGYTLTADGATAPGRGATSDPVTILVERAESPVKLQVYPPLLRLSTNQKGYLTVTGVFRDGTTADLTKSSRVRYTSNVPSVAATKAEGIVTALAPGFAKLLITYDKIKAEVPVTVLAATQR